MSESNPEVILSHLNAAVKEFGPYIMNGHRNELMDLIKKVRKDQCGNCRKWVNDCSVKSRAGRVMTCGGRVIK